MRVAQMSEAKSGIDGAVDRLPRISRFALIRATDSIVK
jgi:hypothetical protein